MDIRYANHPSDSKKYDTEQLREKFLVEKIFIPNKVSLTYSHVDRIIFGGIMPTETKLELKASAELGVEYFLERRELGIINIGEAGVVSLDDVEYTLENQDGLYVPMGIKKVVFSSVNAKNPAKFYISSCPAHQSYDIVKINIKDANPLHLGNTEQVNVRTIYQYVHPAVCKSCQLLMGMTILEPNNVWNTMPCHTHDRRMEVYLYFNFDENNRVFHLMGEAQETRHIVMANEQAVISPSWSIHSGVGTSNYTFIWSMCGENQTFTDMDAIATEKLK